jgi:hypothetical protein
VDPSADIYGQADATELKGHPLAQYGPLQIQLSILTPLSDLAIQITLSLFHPENPTL